MDGMPDVLRSDFAPTLAQFTAILTPVVFNTREFAMRRILRSMGSLAAVAVLAGPALATTNWMSDGDIRAAFAGVTIEGVYASEVTFVESYAADGRIAYTEAQRKMTGQWSVVNAQFCTIYDVSATGGCFRVTRHGDNCFEFYFQSRDKQKAAEPDPGKPSWTAQGWRKGEKPTCNLQPAV
jgi:hypothetical protein